MQCLITFIIHLFHVSPPIAAGSESLVNYFQKGAFLGQKVALNFWYVDTRPNLQKLFPRAYKAYTFFKQIYV